MKDFTALRAKTYSYFKTTTIKTNKKAKALKSVSEKKVKIEDYKHCWKQNKSFRTKKIFMWIVFEKITKNS